MSGDLYERINRFRLLFIKQPILVDLYWRYIIFTTWIFNYKQNMDIKGVITGDIVNSTTIKVDQRKQLIDSIQQIATELKILSPLKIEHLL